MDCSAFLFVLYCGGSSKQAARWVDISFKPWSSIAYSVGKYICGIEDRSIFIWFLVIVALDIEGFDGGESSDSYTTRI
jgi:hypothetical protein